MEPIYTEQFEIDDAAVDRFGRMKPAYYLYLAQEMGGRHCTALSLDYETLAGRGVFWAVSRHRVQITRTPMLGETIRVETWPLPPTRAAYPRSVVAYYEQGNEVFRSMSLWVLMDIQSRKMILPGSSGIELAGTVRGNELAVPGSLMPRTSDNTRQRTIAFTDLDRNGHMNNTRCMDWIADLMPSEFHKGHLLKEFTVCYLAEALEGQELRLSLTAPDDTTMQVDAACGEGEQHHRVFSARLLFGPAEAGEELR